MLGIADMTMDAVEDAGWISASSAISGADATGRPPSAVAMLSDYPDVSSSSVFAIGASFATFDHWRNRCTLDEWCREIPVPVTLQGKNGYSSVLIAASSGVADLAHGRSDSASDPESLHAVRLNASIATKAIRRGRMLAGVRVLEDACTSLFEHGAGGTLAWLAFVTACMDVSPYVVPKNTCDLMPMEELVAISLLSRAADSSLSLTHPMKERLTNTCVALQFHDRADSTSSWRGWRSAEKPATRAVACIEGGDGRSAATAVRDALRCAFLAHSFDLPIERNAMLRHLGALLGHVGEAATHLHELQLPSSEERKNDAQATQEAKHEVLLSANDHTVRPDILIHFQAQMPFAPAHPAQHAVRALAKLINRLSSDVNVRQLKQRFLGAPAGELFRIQQFVQTDNTSGSQKGDTSEDPELNIPHWNNQWEAMNTTEHERVLLRSLRSLQKQMVEGNANKRETNTLQSTTNEVTDEISGQEAFSPSGRSPTPMEARSAFLMLFGFRNFFDVSFITTSGRSLRTSVACSLAGTFEMPAKVQRIAGFVDSKKGTNATLDDEGRVDYGGAEQQHAFIDRGPVLDATLERFLEKFEPGVDVKVPKAPPGFSWTLDASSRARVRAWKDDGNELCFSVNERVVPSFDASPLLKPNNQPAQISRLGGELQGLVRKALYCRVEADERGHIDQAELMERLRKVAELRRAGSHDISADVIPEWLTNAMDDARIPQSGWRDTLVKMATREGTRITIAEPDKTGERLGTVLNQMTEGLTVRLLTMLEALYPSVVRRTSALRFDIDDTHSAFYHLYARLSLLSFGTWHEGNNRFFEARRPHNAAEYQVLPVEAAHAQQDGDNDEPIPTVETPLWQHQREGSQRILNGIRHSGKRGFADASAVGAGKSLTAISAALDAWRFLDEKGIQRAPVLVLVPNKELIPEWTHQIKVHTRGVKTLCQTSSGLLISRGFSQGGEADSDKRNDYSPASIDKNSFVVTTLSRCREHPFQKLNMWSMCIIDECLSVQNDTALQTMEAWRNVEASQLGCLMLSATFFRSSFSKLAYMLRMLGTHLPLSPHYLLAVLSEHIISYVPDTKRKWKLDFVSISLPESVMSEYYNIISNFHKHNTKGRRELFSALKSYLKRNFESSNLLESFAHETDKLFKQKRQPILFASSDAEAQLLLKHIPNARSLNDRGKQRKQQKNGEKETGPLVVTVQRAAHGLNLQTEGDSIVTRPHPGDILEQMKGRISRPGAKRTDLVLKILYAEGTVEEAEAGNVRLCGRFVREWIWPLSEVFQEAAGGAALEAYLQKDSSNAKKRKKHTLGAVAQAFMKGLDDETSCNTLSPARSDSESMTQQQQPYEDDETAKTESDDLQGILSSLQSLSESEFQGALKMLEERESQAIQSGDDGSTSLELERLSVEDIRALQSIIPHCSQEGTGKRQKSSEDASTSEPNYQDNEPSNKSRKKSTATKEEASSGCKRNQKKKKRSESQSAPQEGTKQAKRRKEKAMYATVDDSRSSNPPTLADLQMHDVLKHLSEQDERLASLISQIGTPTSLVSALGGPAFPSLARAIVYQQLSTKAASSIFRRVLALCGGEESFTPEVMLQQSHADLRKAGLSERKVEYLMKLASSFERGELSRERLESLSDVDALELLMAQKGIGLWSSQMYMMFSLGRCDVLPTGDLAIRKAMKRMYGINRGVDEGKSETSVGEHVNLPSQEEMVQVAEAWRPYRTTATWLLWHCTETDSAVYTYWPEGVL